MSTQLPLFSDDSENKTLTLYNGSAMGSIFGVNASPYTVTTNGTQSITWPNLDTFTNTTVSSSLSNKNKLHVRGDAKFEGNVTIGDVDLGKTLEVIQQRLSILHGNPELEERWEELRLLRQRYLDLEAEILEQEAVWAKMTK